MKKSESVFFRSGELRMHAAQHAGGGDWPIVVVPGITTPAGAFAVAGAGSPRSARTSTCSTCGDAACRSGCPIRRAPGR